jgi:hypothetical protein
MSRFVRGEKWDRLVFTWTYFGFAIESLEESDNFLILSAPGIRRPSTHLARATRSGLWLGCGPRRGVEHLEVAPRVLLRSMELFDGCVISTEVVNEELLKLLQHFF